MRYLRKPRLFLAGDSLRLVGYLKREAAERQLAAGLLERVLDPWGGLMGYRVAPGINLSEIEVQWLKGER